MEYKHTVFLTILLIIISFALFSFKNQHNVAESFKNYHMAQPTKCFSCENELADTKKYQGGPSKCFSCEKQIADTRGSRYSDLAQPTKCFSCEKQFR